MSDPSNDIRMVVFDLGRVLVRICDNWKHACELAKIPGTFSELTPASRAELMKLVGAHEVGKIDAGQFSEQAAGVLRVRPEHAKQMQDIYLIGLFPGVAELIAAINGTGLATACLSNTNQTHWGIMSDPTHAAYLPFEKFTHAFASHLIGSRKPDEAIYRHAERVSGFSGSQIVFFDDLRENIDAAERIGWRGRLILPDGDPVSQMRKHLAGLGVELSF